MKSPMWPGLSITLSVNDVDMQEYRDEGTEKDDRDKKVVRYVESVPGEKFSVSLRTQPGFTYKGNDLELVVSLDGVGAYRSACEAILYPHGFDCVVEGIGRNDSQGRGRLERFAYAELQTTNGNAKAELKEKMSKIGEITVEVLRIKVLRRQSIVQNNVWHFRSAVSGGVPEKALKGRAVSNCTKLSAPEKAKQVSEVYVRYPWGKKPFVTFKFKYRSHRDLQIERIIPRSRTHVPLEERDPDNLTLEEARELMRRQRKQISDMTNIKREKRKHSTAKDDDAKDDLLIDRKKTHCGKRARSASDSSVEIIEIFD